MWSYLVCNQSCQSVSRSINRHSALIEYRPVSLSDAIYLLDAAATVEAGELPVSKPHYHSSAEENGGESCFVELAAHSVVRGNSTNFLVLLSHLVLWALRI